MTAMEERLDQEKAAQNMSVASSTTVEDNRAKEALDRDLEDSFDESSERDAEITELARKYTAQSAAHFHQNPFDAEPDSVLVSLTLQDIFQVQYEKLDPCYSPAPLRIFPTSKK